MFEVPSKVSVFLFGLWLIQSQIEHNYKGNSSSIHALTNIPKHKKQIIGH